MTESTFKKYKLVIDEWFVNGFNGVNAYQKYYPNSSYQSADVSFRKILEIPRIKEYIKDKQHQAEIKLEATHESILRELKRWADSDLTEFMMLPPEEIKQMPIELRRLITRFETVKKVTEKGTGKNKTVTTEYLAKVWFVSKEKAIEMINKHIGFYSEHNKQKQPKDTDFSNLTDDELMTYSKLQRKINNE